MLAQAVGGMEILGCWGRGPGVLWNETMNGLSRDNHFLENLARGAAGNSDLSSGYQRPIRRNSNDRAYEDPWLPHCPCLGFEGSFLLGR